jgi:hypothetical protein
MPFKSKQQRKWMHSNIPKVAERWEKEYQKGGKLEGKLDGPSHEQGGIKFNVNGEIQEAEGGEYVVRKNSVNPRTQAVLEHINKTGNVPKYKGGGRITDARKRRK